MNWWMLAITLILAGAVGTGAWVLREMQKEMEAKLAAVSNESAELSRRVGQPQRISRTLMGQAYDSMLWGFTKKAPQTLIERLELLEKRDNELFTKLTEHTESPTTHPEVAVRNSLEKQAAKLQKKAAKIK